MPPKITPFSFARDLNVGDRTSVQCVVVTGDLPLTFTWLKDNVPIEIRTSQDAPPSSHSRVQAPAGPGDAIKGPKRGPKAEGQAEQSPRKAITVRQYDAFTSALSISTIAPAHNGTYTCRVANGAATVAHSALLHVNGKRTPLVYFFVHALTTTQRCDAYFPIFLFLFSPPSSLLSSPIFQPRHIDLDASACTHPRRVARSSISITSNRSFDRSAYRRDAIRETIENFRTTSFVVAFLSIRRDRPYRPILYSDRFRATKLCYSRARDSWNIIKTDWQFSNPVDYVHALEK